MTFFGNYQCSEKRSSLIHFQGSGTSVENLLAVLQWTLHGKQDLTFKAGSTPEDFTLRTLFFFFSFTRETCSCGRGGNWLGAGTGFASPRSVPGPREQSWLAAGRVRVHICVHDRGLEGAAVLPLGQEGSGLAPLDVGGNQGWRPWEGQPGPGAGVVRLTGPRAGWWLTESLLLGPEAGAASVCTHGLWRDHFLVTAERPTASPGPDRLVPAFVWGERGGREEGAQNLPRRPEGQVCLPQVRHPVGPVCGQWTPRRFRLPPGELVPGSWRPAPWSWGKELSEAYLFPKFHRVKMKTPGFPVSVGIWDSFSILASLGAVLGMRWKLRLGWKIPGMLVIHRTDFRWRLFFPKASPVAQQ